MATDDDVYRLDEMFKEHDRLENELAERFQALTRDNSLMEIRDRMRALVKESTIRAETLEGNLAELNEEKHAIERSNQKLLIEVSSLKDRLAEEQERRYKLEQEHRKTSTDLDVKIQTLQRKSLNLEMELKEAKQRSESHAEQIRTVMTENYELKQEVEREKMERRTSLVKLQHEVSTKDKFIRDLELEKARLKEKLDKCHQEFERKDHTISVLKVESVNIRTEFTKLEIKLSSEEQKYNEKFSEMESQKLSLEQENRDLNDQFAAAMRIIREYIRKNARTSEEFSRTRARLDAVDHEQTMHTDKLERDMRRFNSINKFHD